MNRCFMLFVFLVAFNTVPAQNLWMTNDSAFIRQVDLPQISKTKVRASDPERYNYVYMFSYMDFYNLFDVDTFYYRYHDFDFEHYHILGRVICMQCRFCNHSEENTEKGPCHRNACRASWVWTVRSNDKAFTTVPFNGRFPDKTKSRYGDTVVMPVTPADSGKAVWHTSSGGDCHARFKYELLADQYYPVTVLQEYNYYGGCRSGRFSDREFAFIPPPGTKFYRKKIILMDSDGKRE